MDITGATALVTGGGGGIGRALALRAVGAGAVAVALLDLDQRAADGVAEEVRELGARAQSLAVDVSDAEAVRSAVVAVQRELGVPTLVYANAGVALGRGLEATAQDWQGSWDVNVMGVVNTLTAVLPGLVETSGHVVVTASAAGILLNLDSAAYTATKHAAVGLAEWVAVRYGAQGVGVSCLCPQGVRTAMTAGEPADSATLGAGELIEPDQVAEAVLEAVRDNRFLVLPHPEVAQREQFKVADRDRWLRGMRRYWDRLHPAG